VAREPTGRPSGSQSRTAGDAFATVAIQSIRNLIVRADVVNVNSGAIAIDPPVSTGPDPSDYATAVTAWAQQHSAAAQRRDRGQR